MENQETVFVKVLKPIWLFEDEFEVGKVYEAIGEEGYGYSLKHPLFESFSCLALYSEVELINQ